MADHPTSNTEKVISIRTGRPFHPAAGRADTSAADVKKRGRDDEPDDFRHRMVMNAMVFGFVAVLVVSALWLADSLATMRKDQDCVLAGKRGCTAVETPATKR